MPKKKAPPLSPPQPDIVRQAIDEFQYWAGKKQSKPKKA